MRKLLLFIWLFLWTALVVSAQRPNGSSIANGEAASARSFVQRFYDWYAPLATNWEGGSPAFIVAIRRKPQSFAPFLRQALLNDASAQAHAQDIVGLDFDPFLDSQDPDPKFLAASVTKKRRSVLVKMVNESDPKNYVSAEVEKIHGAWAFTNFYGAGGGDLLKQLRSLAKDRSVSK